MSWNRRLPPPRTRLRSSTILWIRAGDSTTARRYSNVFPRASLEISFWNNGHMCRLSRLGARFMGEVVSANICMYLVHTTLHIVRASHCPVSYVEPSPNQPVETRSAAILGTETGRVLTAHPSHEELYEGGSIASLYSRKPESIATALRAGGPSLSPPSPLRAACP